MSRSSFSSAATLKRPQRQTASVLVIDDDPDISQLIVVGLASYNVDVLQAFNGEHGIWVATTEKPDVIITDIRMPQGSGDYVTECLRRNATTRHIPIIVVTALVDEQMKRRLKKLGVEEYFNKPLQLKELRAALSRYVDLRPDLE